MVFQSLTNGPQLQPLGVFQADESSTTLPQTVAQQQAQSLCRRPPDPQPEPIAAPTRPEDDRPTLQQTWDRNQPLQMLPDTGEHQALLGRTHQFRQPNTCPTAYPQKEPDRRHQQSDEDSDHSEQSSSKPRRKDGRSIQHIFSSKDSNQKSTSVLPNELPELTDDDHANPGRSQRHEILFAPVTTVEGTTDLATAFQPPPLHRCIIVGLGGSTVSTQHVDPDDGREVDTNRVPLAHQPSRTNGRSTVPTTDQPPKHKRSESHRQHDQQSLHKQALRKSQQSKRRSTQALPLSSQKEHSPDVQLHPRGKELGCGPTVENLSARVVDTEQLVPSTSGSSRHICIEDEQIDDDLHGQARHSTREVSWGCAHSPLARTCVGSAAVSSSEQDSQAPTEMETRNSRHPNAQLAGTAMVSTTCTAGHSNDTLLVRSRDATTSTDETLDSVLKATTLNQLFLASSAFGPAAAESLQKETDRGSCARTKDTLWRQFVAVNNDTTSLPDLFSTRRITDFMVEKVKKQSRPLTTLQNIAGMVNTATRILGLWEEGRQGTLQYFIEDYQKKHTKKQKETKGFIDATAVAHHFIQQPATTEREKRAKLLTLIACTTMWREESIVRIPVPTSLVSPITLMLPYDKTDLEGRSITLHDSSQPQLALSTAIREYLQSSERTRNKMLEQFGTAPLFVPLWRSKISKGFLTSDTASNDLQLVLSAANQVNDSRGFRIWPSSWRGSSQNRLRRCQVPDGYIVSTGNWKETVRQKHYDNFILPNCWSDLCLGLTNQFIPDDLPNTLPHHEEHHPTSG